MYINNDIPNTKIKLLSFVIDGFINITEINNIKKVSIYFNMMLLSNNFMKPHGNISFIKFPLTATIIKNIAFKLFSK